jgi:hypothetical protein
MQTADGRNGRFCRVLPEVFYATDARLAGAAPPLLQERQAPDGLSMTRTPAVATD